MSNSSKMMILSKEQRDALGAVWQHYTEYIGVDEAEPVRPFEKHISSYLTILLVVAATQNSPDKAHLANTSLTLLVPSVWHDQSTEIYANNRC